MKLVAVDKIYVAEDRLPVDPEVVKKLVDSIPRLGLANPISITFVQDKPVLIAGRNRLEAYRTLNAKKVKGYANIPVHIMETKNPSKIDPRAFTGLVEIDENLARRELTTEQRDHLIARRKELLKSIPETTAPHGAHLSSTETVSRETGLSPRTVQRAAQFDKVFGDDLPRLANTSLGTKAAKESYLKAKPEKQQRLLKQALEEHHGKTTPKPKATKRSSAVTQEELEDRAASKIEFIIDDGGEMASVACDMIEGSKERLNDKGKRRLVQLAESVVRKWSKVAAALRDAD